MASGIISLIIWSHRVLTLVSMILMSIMAAAYRRNRESSNAVFSAVFSPEVLLRVWDVFYEKINVSKGLFHLGMLAFSSWLSIEMMFSCIHLLYRLRILKQS